MENNKNSYGGKRVGAGRPKSNVESKNICVRIKLSDLDKIEKQCKFLNVSISKFFRDSALIILGKNNG